MSTLSGFLNANKVLLLGLLAAIGTVVQQFVQSGPINYAVMAWAVVIASIGFVANNLHGQVATILSSLLPTVDVIYESTKNNAAISWGHMALLAGVAIVGAITGPAKAVATKTSVIILLVMVGMTVQAQSPFKTEPKIVANHPNVFARATVAQSDSIVNAWRFSVPVSPVGYTLAGVYQASAGLAYGFQKQDYNFTTQQYTVLWSLSGVVIPIQTGMPIRSIKDVANFGILVGGLTQKIGLPSNSINIGPFYNVNAPGTFRDKFGFWLTGTVNLN